MAEPDRALDAMVASRVRESVWIANRRGALVSFALNDTESQRRAAHRPRVNLARLHHMLAERFPDRTIN
jgi:hypothetical protein